MGAADAEVKADKEVGFPPASLRSVCLSVHAPREIAGCALSVHCFPRWRSSACVSQIV